MQSQIAPISLGCKFVRRGTAVSLHIRQQKSGILMENRGALPFLGTSFSSFLHKRLRITMLAEPDLHCNLC